MARQSTYNDKVARTICDRLAEGESLDRICEDTPGFPSAPTVRRWVLENAGGTFAADYTRARELQAHKLAEEILAIADTPEIGSKTKIDDDGKTEVTEGDMIEHRRLRVDARKWYLSKVLPKVYGDKQQIEHSGEMSLVSLVQESLKKPDEPRGD